MAESNVPDLRAVTSPPRRALDYTSISGGEVIGQGGQAVVRRVDLPDGPPDVIAVKEPLAPTGTVDTEVVARFLDQAETWHRIDDKERDKPIFKDSNHIVGVVDIGDKSPWIAMEYMDGGSLADRLDDHPDGLPIDEALWIAECLCKGLKVAHDSGVAHLDLKPANVLFRETAEGNWNVPKIGDWGLAQTLIEHSQSMEAYSVEYAAPEQFDSSLGSADKHTDIYQLGAVMYAMLTGRPPHTGSHAEIRYAVLNGDGPTPPSAHRDAIPDGLDEVVCTALSHSKSDRFQGEVGRFADAIRNMQTGEGQSTARSSVTSTQPADTSPESSEVSGSTTGKTSTVLGATRETDSWPMFRQNSARTGGPRLPRGSGNDTSDPSTATERWHGETTSPVSSSPAVVDNTVYVGCDDGNLYALDAATGEPRWHYETEDHVRSSPAVVDGTVYVGSHDGSLYALDATTGEREWSYPTHGKVLSSPAVVDDTVYFTSGDDNLYSIDTVSGTESWQKSNVDHRSSPAVVDGTVYVGSDDGGLYALDASTGETHWHHDPDADVCSSPAVVDDTVYFIAGRYLRTLNATTGETYRQNTGSVPLFDSPAVADDTVYLFDLHPCARDKTTLRTEWELWTDPTEKFHPVSAPVVVDGAVYFGGRDIVSSVNAATGEVHWLYELDATAKSSLSVVGDTVYVGCDDGIHAIGIE